MRLLLVTVVALVFVSACRGDKDEPIPVAEQPTVTGAPQPHGALLSHYGAKLYLDQVLAKKQILQA